ncbi:MAG TPA: hypothetical protein VJN71_05590 [Nitrososphaerales archaeon]|nr:hypothetical protein [Nitrososphaerales archaeon]
MSNIAEKRTQYYMLNEFSIKHMNFRALALGIGLVLLISSLYPTIQNSQSSANSGTNPAWIFQNSIFGHDVSGYYNSGIAKIHYVASYSNSRESFDLTFPGGVTTTYSVARSSSGIVHC